MKRAIIVHNNNNSGNWRKLNRERVEKECDTEASWLSMYMATLRQYLAVAKLGYTAGDWTGV